HPRVVAEASLENLRQMRVSIDQARHDDHLRAVDASRDRKPARLNLSSQPGNGPIMNKNLLRFEDRLRGVQRNDGRVFQQDCHRYGYTSSACSVIVIDALTAYSGQIHCQASARTASR